MVLTLDKQVLKHSTPANLMVPAKKISEGRRGSTTFVTNGKGTFDTQAPEFSFKGNNKQSDGNSDAPTQETWVGEQNPAESLEIDVRRRRKNLETAEERRQFVENYTKKLKTELCKNWELKGTCRYGDTCSFAHGRHQLRPKTDLPVKYKTKPCQQYHTTGFCYYGYRCHYLHEKDENPEKTLENRSKAITAAMAAVLSQKYEIDGITFQKSRRLGVFERLTAAVDCDMQAQ